MVPEPEQGHSPTLSDFPQSLGDYVLLQPLDRGGMGEVYLAKHSKVEGIEKFCVVKTLRPRFTSDVEYVDRFIDEARIVVHLGHRNICQVFDVGKVAERYYLAMELIPGRDLRRVLDAAWTSGRGMPIDLALHLISQVLEALDYAHRHVHPTTGKPLGLVHRDVSPQNVMVNLEGEVKLIDFGLAATNLRTEDSDDGVVMGKLSYMSPEQLCGDKIGSRSDVYSAAIMAYEMLVGARFYEGLPRNEIWDVALEGYLPPRIHELPTDLREILTRALVRVPAERLGCDELLEEIEQFRHEHRHHAGARQLRSFMGELFPGGEAEVHRLLLKYATTQPMERGEPVEMSVSIARSEATLGTQGLESIRSHEATASLTLTERSTSGKSATDDVGGLPAVALPAASALEESAAETARHLHAVPPPSQRSNVAGIVAGLFALLIVVGAFLVARGPRPAPESPPGRADVVTPIADRPESPATGQEPASSPLPSVAVTTPLPSTPAPTLRAAPPAPAPPRTQPPAIAAPTPPPPGPPAPAQATTTPVVATPPPAPRMTWTERLDFLSASCADLPCASPLINEFAGRALPDIPTKRLGAAVREIRACVESCRDR